MSLSGRLKANRPLPAKVRELAAGLGFVEGPLALPNGRIIFCAGTYGRLDVLENERLDVFAAIGGGPNGTALGRDGSIYVAQSGEWDVGENGVWRRRSEPTIEPSIQQVGPDGVLVREWTEIDGIPPRAPNDLAFGPDERLWLTDPGEAGYTDPEPGRIYALGPDAGELVLELGPVFPNGIAFDPDGRLLWTESTTRRVCCLEESEPRVLNELPNDHIPDGLAVAADGRLFVATLSSGGVTVLSPDGERRGHVDLDCLPTNCAFRERSLIVTAVTDMSGGPGTGTLREADLDLGGLPLHVGEI